ncbi:MAG: hypothetical protein Ct9H90mP9_0650 [Pseudomonadota bacterium]|nr:MAG: hypothetical protein Ct9H90mP9_0650 [Pseudomonadota bacterium]
MQLVKQRFPGKAIMAFGYSLGGNSLLKWLGEQGSEAGITAAALRFRCPLTFLHAQTA